MANATLSLNVGLPDDTLRLLGEMIIVAAEIDFSLNTCVGLLEADEPMISDDGKTTWLVPQRAHHVTNVHPRIADLKRLSDAIGDPDLHGLVREFRWAMTKVTKVRNFVAHGMLLWGEPPSFWSQRKMKSMSLPDILATAPKFTYAKLVIQRVRWKLLRTPIPTALPDRPV